jgi:ADP-heptose:LPS heptosyltransferase
MRLLVIRTSAMGDVALTSPVIKGMREQYPDIEILLLTSSAFKSFFSSIDGIFIFTPDFKKRHKGITGLKQLYKDITKETKIDFVIDLHDIIRSKILRSIFELNGIPVSVIDKGRREKRALIRGKRKIQLKHTIERYCDAFAKVGFHVEPGKGPWINPSFDAIVKADKIIGQFKGLNIGVAPYAKHHLKMWQEENMVHLLNLISEKQNARFWLFGGKDESDKLDSFMKKVPGSKNIAGKITVDEELGLIRKLDFMIAMDSSNMHMAALVGTNTISIWGGTDPLNGFGAWMQPEDRSIRISVKELTCRPCTTYGKGKCRRGDLACLTRLTAEIVISKIEAAGIFGSTIVKD